MEHLVNGQWGHEDKIFGSKRSKGEFIREESQSKNSFSADTQPVSTGKGRFQRQIAAINPTRIVPKGPLLDLSFLQ